MNTVHDIDSYIESQPEDVQPALKRLWETIKRFAPQAEEKISYGIPTFVLNGNLAHFGAFKSHIGFFPTSSGVVSFKKELSSYKTSKGAI